MYVRMVSAFHIEAFASSQMEHTATFQAEATLPLSQDIFRKMFVVACIPQPRFTAGGHRCMTNVITCIVFRFGCCCKPWSLTFYALCINLHPYVTCCLVFVRVL